MTDDDVRRVKCGSSRCRDSRGTTWTIERMECSMRGWTLRVRCYLPGPRETKLGQGDITNRSSDEEGLVLL